MNSKLQKHHDSDIVHILRFFLSHNFYRAFFYALVAMTQIRVFVDWDPLDGQKFQIQSWYKEKDIVFKICCTEEILLYSFILMGANEQAYKWVTHFNHEKP